jgi:hypothetical protein
LIATNGVGELGGEIRPGFVFTAPPRDELALMPVDICERAKAIPFHLIDPVGMIERLTRDGKRHRCEFGEHRIHRVFRAARDSRAELQVRPFGPAGVVFGLKTLLSYFRSGTALCVPP